MPSERTRLGNQGEEMAAQYLLAEGLEVLERNFRTRYGEVDLVARDGPAIVFVEVRTRRSATFGTPEESVTVRKRQKVVLAAQQYLQDHGLDQAEWRVDVVAIRLGGSEPTINHVQGIEIA